jgi:broad specificity phosphatase PhoE
MPAAVLPVLLLLLLLPPPLLSTAQGPPQQCDAARHAGLTLAERPRGSPRAAAAEPDDTLPPRCKALTLVRHAQGTHNRAEDATDLQPRDAVLLEEHSGRTYWDAPLTPDGEAQALALRRQVAAAAPRVEIVVSSSLRRALQTATLALGAGADLPRLSLPGPPTGAPPILATELCRERVADFTCDGRSDRSLLQEAFPAVDFSELTNENDPMWAEKEAASGELKCRERAVRFAEWLMARSERHIAVVSHGHFLRHLMAELAPEQDAAAQPPRLRNAEMRQMVLCPADSAAYDLPTDAEYEEEEAALWAAERAAWEVDEAARIELEHVEQERNAEQEMELNELQAQQRREMEARWQLAEQLEKAEQEEMAKEDVRRAEMVRRHWPRCLPARSTFTAQTVALARNPSYYLSRSHASIGVSDVSIDGTAG